MINSDSPFGEALEETGIPENHSLFEAAYGKNTWGEYESFGKNDFEKIGFRLMPLKEAASYAMQGKDVLWFAEELRRRYENIHYFFNRL